MAERKVDIVIFGGGIAGLWSLAHLTKRGYNVLLLESRAIGGGQSVASQGILHSGLKYAFAGHISSLAKSISEMPDLWREALKGKGPVNLSGAKVNARTQFLLVPPGLLGGLIGLVTRRALGGQVRDMAKEVWPQNIRLSGFKGNVIFMDEPVVDVPSVVRTLAEPLQDRIRLIDTPDDPMGFLARHGIEAKHIIFTAAGSNAALATQNNHNKGLETQARPLLMGMLKPAPFEMYAHLVGPSDKPVATITTHKNEAGEIIWYLGGLVAERKKESNPKDVYIAAHEAFEKYFPNLKFKDVQWASFGIDRFEGQSKKDGWLPDAPTIHSIGNVHYCWPTKLVFAPMLADRLSSRITDAPGGGEAIDWSFLPAVPYANPPWEESEWKSES